MKKYHKMNIKGVQLVLTYDNEFDCDLTEVLCEWSRFSKKDSFYIKLKSLGILKRFWSAN